MLYIVQKHMGDHSLEVMKGALDEVLAILKAEGMTDTERKQEIEILLEKIDDSEFNTLIVLGQQLTDYFKKEQKQQRGQDDEKDEMPVDPDIDFSASETIDFEDNMQGQITKVKKDKFADLDPTSVKLCVCLVLSCKLSCLTIIGIIIYLIR